MAAEETAASAVRSRGEDPTQVLVAPSAAAAAQAAPAPTLGAHPRYAAKLRRAREAAGLAGFVIALWLAHSTHSFSEAVARAIVAGLLAQLVVWGAGVLLGRQLVGAELRAHQEAALRRAQLTAQDPAQER